MSKELLYPEGRLIARGSVALPSGNTKANPYGYVKASDVNILYTSDDATLFILAVGREGTHCKPHRQLKLLYEVW